MTATSGSHHESVAKYLGPRGPVCAIQLCKAGSDIPGCSLAQRSKRAAPKRQSMKPLSLLCAALWLAGCGGSGDSEPPPALSVSDTAANLAGTVGDAPSATEIMVRNAGGGTLTFQVRTALVDLDAAPAGGSLAAGQSASIQLSYTCQSPGTHEGTVQVSGAGETMTVSVTAECSRPPFVYPDGPVLPRQTAVPTPWHLTSVGVELQNMPAYLESFCTTFRIDGEVDPDTNFYFSPFNGRINGISYYGGIQARIDGLNASGSRLRRNQGAIFSRWEERDLQATMRANDGLNQSLGNEGEFISVRNDFLWGEGHYRLCLDKGDAIAGDPLPEEYEIEEIHFAWGKYAHTWVRMEATDLQSGATAFVGALAFPGSMLALRDYNILFAEIYGRPTPFQADRVPKIAITVEDFQVNGAALPYRRVGALSNTIPGEGREPKLTRIRYNAESGEIRMEIGEFTGRFGVVRTHVFPSRPAIERVALVTSDEQRFVAALWDGRSLAASELPEARFNIRAGLVDAERVASVRLQLTGPVSMSRLTNESPYLLSSGATGLLLPAGNYNLVATPYSEPGGEGEEGGSLKIGFQLD